MRKHGKMPCSQQVVAMRIEARKAPRCCEKDEYPFGVPAFLMPLYYHIGARVCKHMAAQIYLFLPEEEGRPLVSGTSVRIMM